MLSYLRNRWIFYLLSGLLSQVVLLQGNFSAGAGNLLTIPLIDKHLLNLMR